MAVITMCLNYKCDKASTCYRIKAKESRKQTYQNFKTENEPCFNFVKIMK